jgi:hypothetical protein
VLFHLSLTRGELLLGIPEGEMMNVRSKRLAASAAIAGSFFLWGAAANASTVSIGINGTEVATGSNSAIFSGSSGTFNVNLLTGTSSFSFLGSTSNNQSSAGGTLQVEVTELGLTPGIYTFTNSGFTVQGNFSSITEKTYYDPANGKFTTTNLIASSGAFAGPAIFPPLTAASAGPSNVSFFAPFSLTEIFDITLPVGGDDQSSIRLDWTFERLQQNTPLPAALPLFASVLGGGGLLARWRRKRSSKIATA